MKYIIQVFTGGWQTAGTSSGKIIERLSHVMEILPVEKVIIGWHLDRELYREVGRFLHEKDVEMLLWLPVFSEISELEESRESTDLFGGKVGNLALQEGENFSFSCPSSEQNINNVVRVYERHFSDCGFDGVFLDKIRTQSFVGGTGGVLSCGCERCRSIYRKYGFDADSLTKENAASFLETRGYEKGTGFRMKDPGAEAFLEGKSRIIAEGVNRLCASFRNKGMTVGLDLYAPLMSRFTGQDYTLIGKEADFIKPMMYRKTEAPAGIGYEYRLLRENVPGYPDIVFDKAFLREQLEEIRDLPCQKYPGIEINYREDIARTDPDYIRESLSVLKECGMDGAVLSWDIMMAPDDHIKAVKEAEENAG